MEIKNLSWNEHIANKNNHPLLPKSLRGLIVGESGCGKTTLMLNLLLQPGWLDYSKLSVFGKSFFQPEYKILRKGFEEQLPKEMIMNIFENHDEILREQISPNEVIHELAKNQKNLSKEPIEGNFYESADDVPDPKEISPEHKNRMIFDDLLLQKQNKCEAYYVRGKHSNCDCVYLSQNYFKLPCQTIRENTNFFCLFPQDQKNIDHIFNDHMSQDMTKEQFKKLCKHTWSKPHNFVVIDLTLPKNCRKYRSGFDDFYIIS